MSTVIESGISIGPGVIIGDGSSPAPSANLVLSLDAAGYSSGPWVDTVSSRSFTLNGGVSYSADGGGSLVFDPASGQYAQCSSSLNNLSTWSVEIWHYYAGTNAGVDGGSGASIITEVFTGTPSAINYSIGNDAALGSPTDLQSGFFDGAWRATPTGYSLTAGNWYQIVGTYDGSTIKLYVNNSLVNSTSYTGTPISSTHGIRLMRRWDNADYWGGKLGIVKIYDGDIGASGVTTSWNANKTRFGLGGGSQQAYTTPGTYSWTAPAGVTSVCVVCVGGGAGAKGTFPSTGGGGGGGLGWKNNISVTPGQSYTVVVGAGGTSTGTHAGGNSYFISLATVAGYGGVSAGYNDILGTRANYVGDGGGQGGAGAGNGDNYVRFGGGGAGGYNGQGGDGGGGQNNNGSGTGAGYAGYPPATGSGGGGGGGMDRPGGGVGILGQGADGTSPGRTFSNPNWIYYAGTGGSGGTSSGNLYNGGIYGGGGAGANNSNGGDGAVRIIWGAGRAFPDTNTADV